MVLVSKPVPGRNWLRYRSVALSTTGNEAEKSVSDESGRDQTQEGLYITARTLSRSHAVAAREYPQSIHGRVGE